MQYYESFEYPAENLPPALLLSQYLAFNLDRAKRPEFFCWPGVWLTSPLISKESQRLYEKHAPIFVDKEDDDGIFPRILPGRDEAAVHKTFETFYQFIVTYDMTLQWITKPGAFQYDCHKWLATDATPEAAKLFADSAIETTFGVSPDNFEMVRAATPNGAGE